jgi:hypothetical protein
MIETILSRPDALRPVLVASHPRSGTHLVMDLLRRQFRSLNTWRAWGLPLDYLYLNLERLGADSRRFPEALARRIVNRPRRALLKTHFDARFEAGWALDETVPPARHWLQLVSQAHAIYVLRHPLDVMASYHQFLCGIDKNLVELDFMSFLRSSHWDGSSNRLVWWSRHVMGWAERNGVIVLRYEDIVDRTGDILAQVSVALGEGSAGIHPLLPPKITSASQSRLKRLVRLSPSSTAIVADRNRFPAHNWRKSLTTSDLTWIEQQIGDSLSRFGYAVDPNFAVNPLLP